MNTASHAVRRSERNGLSNVRGRPVVAERVLQNEAACFPHDLDAADIGEARRYAAKMTDHEMVELAR